MNKIKLNWRDRLYKIIDGTNSSSGKGFDIILLIMIMLSLILTMMESVPSIRSTFKEELNISEWIITVLFSIEYILRIIISKKPLKYIFSFYGTVDLLSTIPKYISIVFIGTQSLVAIRALRLLRIFRVLKLTRYIGESNFLLKALIASRLKILVFLFAVVIVCIIFGTIMYLLEGEENGFTSIPKSIYWCIVTLTTVGYGDIAPQSTLGQFLASLIMILGYGIIAVPTGIVSIEISHQKTKMNKPIKTCSYCTQENHQDKAKYCYNCGNLLD